MTFKCHTGIESMDCSSDTETATAVSENSVIDQHLEAELLMKIVTGRFVNMSTQVISWDGFLLFFQCG